MLSDTRNYLNLEKVIYTNMEKDNKFDIPVMNATHFVYQDFAKIQVIDYKNAKKLKDSDKNNYMLHFFIDDYHFNSLWNRPDKYISFLTRFKYVLAMDFSLYIDFPRCIQLYNHYRKQWLSKFYADLGINIIPTVAWSDESSYEWCFLGIPRDDVVAVSSVGTQKSKNSKELFIKGYKKMLEILRPKKVIFYGKVPNECVREEVEIINIEPFYKRLRSL